MNKESFVEELQQQQSRAAALLSKMKERELAGQRIPFKVNDRTVILVSPERYKELIKTDKNEIHKCALKNDRTKGLCR